MFTHEIVQKYNNSWVALSQVVTDGERIFSAEVVESAASFSELAAKPGVLCSKDLVLRYATDNESMRDIDCVLYATYDVCTVEELLNKAAGKKYLFLYQPEFNENGGLINDIFAGTTDSNRVRVLFSGQKSIVCCVTDTMMELYV